MIYKYGIDFGTTNSSIAIRFVGNDEEEHTVVVDVKDTSPRVTIPSVVLINSAGEIVAGEEALDDYVQGRGRGENNRLFIKKIKLYLEEKGSELEYFVGNKTIPGDELIAAILRELRLKVEKALEDIEMVEDIDIEVSGVVMGVPVQYGDIQKNILKKALVKAGFYTSDKEAEQNTEFVSEPIAVAVHYGNDLKKDKTVMVFDFGGGTLDLAIVNLKEQVTADRLHPHETIAKERLTLGGEELTKLFFTKSFCHPKKYGTQYISKAFGFSEALTPEELWEKLLKCQDGIKFISAIEKCKCDLSRAKTYSFSFVGRNIQLDEVVFYRENFSRAIETKLGEIDDLIEKCLEQGGIDDLYDIDQVVLAGGSSMIPAVQELLIDKFGSNRVSSKMMESDEVVKRLKRNKNKASESEVLTSIVRGLAMVGCKDETLIEDVVDNDYGVWDNLKKEFIPIIEKGTRVRDTALDKITKQGTFENVECIGQNVFSVEVRVYQRNLNGEQKLGTINIPNPGGKKYKIYMQIDKKKGTLEVTIYDRVKQRWIEEIPLNERTYTLK